MRHHYFLMKPFRSLVVAHRQHRLGFQDAIQGSRLDERSTRIAQFVNKLIICVKNDENFFREKTKILFFFRKALVCVGDQRSVVGRAARHLMNYIDRFFIDLFV